MEVNYNNYRGKLGKVVKAKRQEKGLSREALAERIEGVCSKTIGFIEKANYSRDIGLFTIQSVCKELGLSIKITLGAYDGKNRL